MSGDEEIRVGIDGPFGAPVQRFPDYRVTPFSAILTDLEESFTERKDPWADPWADRWRSRSILRRRSRQSSRAPSESDKTEQQPVAKHPNPDRRIDFHWTVREKNNLLWFSDLLNRAIEGSYPLACQGNMEVNINTHITAKRKNISTHVFRYLLDSYRTTVAPYSALTGLKQPSHFGRCDSGEAL